MFVGHLHDPRRWKVGFPGASSRLLEGNEVVATHVENQSRMLAPLTKSERKELAGLLRKLLVGWEGE